MSETTLEFKTGLMSENSLKSETSLESRRGSQSHESQTIEISVKICSGFNVKTC